MKNTKITDYIKIKEPYCGYQDKNNMDSNSKNSSTVKVNNGIQPAKSPYSQTCNNQGSPGFSNIGVL